MRFFGVHLCAEIALNGGGYAHVRGADMRGQFYRSTGLSTARKHQSRYGMGGGEAINKRPPFTTLTLANG